MSGKHPQIAGMADREASRRRVAAEALFAVMDAGEFDLDQAAVDRLNGPTFACPDMGIGLSRA
jgi:hypothetical protein